MKSSLLVCELNRRPNQMRTWNNSMCRNLTREIAVAEAIEHWFRGDWWNGLYWESTDPETDMEF